MTTPTKLTGAQFKELLLRLRTLLTARGMLLVTLGALERRQVEDLARRLLKARAEVVQKLSRQELAAKVALAALANEPVAMALVKQLDRATTAERSLVASLSIEAAPESIGSLAVLRFRRNAARIVWALVRDDRSAMHQLVHGILAEHLAESEQLEQARVAVKEKGAEAELAYVESLYRQAAERAMKLEEEFSAVVRERTALRATVGETQRELQAEAERRAALAAQLAQLRQPTEPVVARPPRVEPAIERQAALGRKTERVQAALLRERDELRLALSDLERLSGENAELRRSLDGLRERLAQANVMPAVLAPTPGRRAPLVGPPPPLSPQGDVRVGVFLDVANLSGAARRLFDRAVDFDRLLMWVVDGRRRALARAYVIDKGSEGFEPFANALKAQGYKVLKKQPKQFADGSLKADWDVGIVVDMLEAVADLDVVVLGSGDGDFLPAVNALKRRGVAVEIAAFEARAATELCKAATRLWPLGEAHCQR